MLCQPLCLTLCIMNHIAYFVPVVYTALFQLTLCTYICVLMFTKLYCV